MKHVRKQVVYKENTGTRWKTQDNGNVRTIENNKMFGLLLGFLFFSLKIAPSVCSSNTESIENTPPGKLAGNEFKINSRTRVRTTLRSLRFHQTTPNIHPNENIKKEFP